MNQDIFNVLSKLPFLADARPEIIQRLVDTANERRFAPGQIILEEGAIGREMMVILEGQVEVLKGQGSEEIFLASRGAGEIFGEMAFIEALPRFATIRAMEPTLVLEFSESDLRAALILQPELLFYTTQLLSSRLRQAELQLIADLQQKNRELLIAYQELQQAQAALIDKERMEHEMQLARDLQKSILPEEFPRLPGFDCAAHSVPARQVGGDFYDIFMLDKHCVGLVIADVSDKGMPAALYMALSRSLIRAEARRKESPREVLLNVHRLLLEITQSNMFVTVFYGVLDVDKHKLTYVRAGHDLPLLVRPAQDECTFLRAKGTLLGMNIPITLEEVQIDLQVGDFLVLYTDGVTDANSPSGELFGADRLRESMCALTDATAQEVCDMIFKRVEQFQTSASQYDDITAAVVHLCGEND
jgi:phosphoserine phosphatase RsbU/P